MLSFNEYAARKERRAVTATLPPYLTEQSNAPPDAVAIGNEWTSRLFDGPFYASPPRPNRPACSLVFVQSADGNTGAADPGELGGGDTDKHLIYEGLSRVAVDAVLAGAETVRGGNVFFSVWHPELAALRQSLGKPRHPTQIIATLRGMDLGAGLVFNVPSVPVILLTVDAIATQMASQLSERPWIDVIAMDRAEDLPTAFAELRRRGIGSVSCVGGRTLARPLLDARLIDDLYLTTAPKPGGESSTPLHTKPIDGEVVVRKRGTQTERGVIFEQVHCPRVLPLR